MRCLSHIPDETKRFLLFDDLGYFRSYTSRRRALQAVKEAQKPYKRKFKLRDSQDNSVSFVS